MSDDNTTINLIALGGLSLFFLTVLVTLLAWITYGTIEGVLGMLSYIIMGILLIYPLRKTGYQSF